MLEKKAAVEAAVAEEAESARVAMELRETLLRHRATNQPLGVADLDLSQNPLLMEHYRQIFHLLGKVGARVERFRFYGCVTFNDEAIGILATHIAGLSADNVPLELHLSDCAITTDGFKLLMHALDENPQIGRAHV